MQALLLSFLAGLVSATGFAPLKLWPLTLIALAGLMWLVADSRSLKSALARGYWFGAGQFMLGLNWIATAFTYQAKMPAWLGWVSVVLLALFLAIFPAVAAGLGWRYGRRRAVLLVLVFAAAWIVTEWLRATILTGFAWNPLGVALLPTRVSTLATIIGTYGLSGMTTLLGGAIYLLARRDTRPALYLVLPIGLLSPVIPALRGPTPPPTRTALHIVQPNIGQENKWREGFEEINFDRLRRLSLPRGDGKPRLLLWPEAAVTDPLQDGRQGPYYEARTAERLAKVTAMLGPNDLLLTGGINFRSADGQRLTSATNSVFAITAGGIRARYDKAHLVPYGEYLPMRPIMSALGLSRLAPGDVDFDPGPGPQTLAIPGVGKVGFQICYEIIFSDKVVEEGVRPAFIFNPSNDAWFGAWGPPQHLAQSRLRALEEGLPVLRSTPTGISAVIDADGRLLHALPWRTAGSIEALLPAPRAPTIFARVGNLAAFMLAGMLILLAIAVARKAR